MRLIRTWALLSIGALAACSIPPRVDKPALRNEAPVAGLPTASGAAWPDANWWTRYGDPQLDGLIERALKDSPTIATARARFEVARAAVDVARAELGVRVDANAQVARTRLSEHGLFPTEFLGFTWYSQADIGAQFSYEFDWWGRKRSALTASLDETRAAAAERDAAVSILTNAVVESYFEWQADAARLAIAERIVGAAEHVLAIDRARV